MESLLLKKFDEVIDIVTDKDLTRKVLSPEFNSDSTEVAGIMMSPLLTIGLHIPIDQANDFMLKNKI